MPCGSCVTLGFGGQVDCKETLESCPCPQAQSQDYRTISILCQQCLVVLVSHFVFGGQVCTCKTNTGKQGLDPWTRDFSDLSPMLGGTCVTLCLWWASRLKRHWKVVPIPRSRARIIEPFLYSITNAWWYLCHTLSLVGKHVHVKQTLESKDWIHGQGTSLTSH